MKGCVHPDPLNIMAQYGTGVFFLSISCEILKPSSGL